MLFFFINLLTLTQKGHALNSYIIILLVNLSISLNLSLETGTGVREVIQCKKSIILPNINLIACINFHQAMSSRLFQCSATILLHLRTTDYLHLKSGSSNKLLYLQKLFQPMDWILHFYL